ATPHFSSCQPPRLPSATLFPYTTLFRSSTPLPIRQRKPAVSCLPQPPPAGLSVHAHPGRSERKRLAPDCAGFAQSRPPRSSHKRDRKSTRLHSSHVSIAYAVFCLKQPRA